MKTTLLTFLALTGCPLAGALPPSPAKPACCAEQAAERPLAARSLYQLDATWTDDEAQPVRLATLRGQPVILAMIFTHCEYACPVIVHDIRRLLAALPEQTRGKSRVVLVSFDVARDTPAVLNAFRGRMELDANWTLLRGEADAVQELAMLLGVKFKADARGQFAHSNLITVLDAEGRIAHQHAGLKGDISGSAKAVTATANPP